MPKRKPQPKLKPIVSDKAWRKEILAHCDEIEKQVAMAAEMIRGIRTSLKGKGGK